MASEEFAGPVDYLVFSFDQGTDIGPGMQALLVRVDQGIIEVLDIELISKDSAGHPSKSQFADLLAVTGFDLGLLEGVDSGILDAEDMDTIVADLQDGQFAVAIVYEDRSLATAAEAWVRAGGAEVFSGGVAISDLDHALEEKS